MDSKQRTKKENHSLKTKAHAIHLCFLHAEPPPPPHRSLEQKELSPCRPLLAQTSTTPYTEAHRHRGRWSCAWSLETYRSRRDHNPKVPFQQVYLLWFLNSPLSTLASRT
nr:hypothetical protein CFP56_33872 [Quercus suber]